MFFLMRKMAFNQSGLHGFLHSRRPNSEATFERETFSWGKAMRKHIQQFALLSCTAASISAMLGCTTKKSAPSTPVSIAVEYPKLPANLSGSTWLAPFQVNILIEGANNFIHKQAITGDTVLDLSVYPGQLRVRANYFGIEIPTTVTPAEICNDGGKEEGSGPAGIYVATSDQTVNVSGTTDIAVSFSGLQNASEIKYAITARYSDGAPASLAKLTYLDSLTKLPFTGPCDLATTHGPREEADPLGRISGKFFGVGSTTIFAVVTHNGVSVPISFSGSSTNVLENFYSLNLSNQTITQDGNGDFDGDGILNASDADPFCGPNSWGCSDYSTGAGAGTGTGPGPGGTNGGTSGPLYLSEMFPVDTSDTNPAHRVTFTFNQAVDYTTVPGNIVITPSTGTAEACVPNTSLETISPYIVECINALSPQISYNVTILPDTIKSAAGTAAAFTPDTFTFSTGMSNPTTVPTFTVKIDNNIQPDTISTNGHVDIEFTKPMNRTTLSNFAQLTNTTTGFVHNLSCKYQVQSWGTYASNNMCCDVLNSSSQYTNLDSSTRYILSVGGALSATDNYGLAIASRQSLEFSTEGTASDTTPPTLDFTFPIPSATNVDADTWVAAIYNEKMTFNQQPYIELYNAANESISMDNCNTLGNGVYCKPNSPLTPGSAYTALINGATDLGGNDAGAISWTFTVSSSAIPSVIPLKAQLVIPDIDGFGSGALGKIFGIRYGVLLNKKANTSYGAPYINVFGGGTLYDSCTSMCPSSSNFDGYLLTRTFKETPMLGATLTISPTSSIQDMASNTITNATTMSAALTIPSVVPLKILRTIPAAGEKVSKNSPLVLFLNKSISSPSGSDISILNLTDVGSTSFSCTTPSTAIFNDSWVVRCSPGMFASGKTYRVTANLSGLNGSTNSPGSFTWEFSTWDSEYGVSVVSTTPSPGAYLAASSNISGEVFFNRFVTAIPNVQMCSLPPSGTSPTCAACTAAAPYFEPSNGRYKSTFGCSGAFTSGMNYKISVSTSTPDTPLAVGTYSWVVKN